MPKKMIVKVKDLSILSGIRDFQIAHGYSPTIREVMPLAETTSTSVANYCLDRLEGLGLIVRERKISRGIRIVQRPGLSVGPVNYLYCEDKSMPDTVWKSGVPSAKHRFKAGIALAGARVRQERLRQTV